MIFVELHFKCQVDYFGESLMDLHKLSKCLSFKENSEVGGPLATREYKCVGRDSLFNSIIEMVLDRKVFASLFRVL